MVGLIDHLCNVCLGYEGYIKCTWCDGKGYLRLPPGVKLKPLNAAVQFKQSDESIARREAIKFADKWFDETFSDSYDALDNIDIVEDPVKQAFIEGYMKGKDHD